METKLLTTDQAAGILGVSERTIRNWAARGVLDGIRVHGRMWLFDPQVIKRFRRPKRGRPRK